MTNKDDKDEKEKEKDYCSDCGAEFTDYHYCEYARSLDVETKNDDSDDAE